MRQFLLAAFVFVVVGLAAAQQGGSPGGPQGNQPSGQQGGQQGSQLGQAANQMGNQFGQAANQMGNQLGQAANQMGGQQGSGQQGNGQNGSQGDDAIGRELVQLLREKCKAEQALVKKLTELAKNSPNVQKCSPVQNSSFTSSMSPDGQSLTINSLTTPKPDTASGQNPSDKNSSDKKTEKMIGALMGMIVTIDAISKQIPEAELYKWAKKSIAATGNIEEMKLVLAPKLIVTTAKDWVKKMKASPVSADIRKIEQPVQKFGQIIQKMAQNQTTSGDQSGQTGSDQSGQTGSASSRGSQPTRPE